MAVLSPIQVDDPQLKNLLSAALDEPAPAGLDTLALPDNSSPVVLKNLVSPAQPQINFGPSATDRAAKLAATPTGLTHFGGYSVKPVDVNGASVPQAVKNEPTSFWGKLGKVAEAAGNIVGDVLAPGTMSLIPGTQLYRQAQHNAGLSQLANIQSQQLAKEKQDSETAMQSAQAKKDLADAALAQSQTVPGGKWKDDPDLTYNGRAIQSNEFGQHRFTDTGEIISTAPAALNPIVGNNPTTGTGLTPISPIPATAPTGTGFARVAAPNAANRVLTSAEATKINGQITNALKGAGIDASAYAVDPTAMVSQANESLAAAQKAATEARANKTAERVAGAPEAAQERKDARTMGYAIDQDTGELKYMSLADANAQHSTFEPVTPQSILKDRQALRQLNDVQMNISRYSNAINSIKGNISTKDVETMQGILSNKNLGVKAELFGVGLDLGMMNDAIKGTEVAKDWNELNPDEQNLVLGYLRAKSSVLAYQRALTGVSRTSESQLELEMNQLPTPGVGATVGNKQMDAFQENIDQAAAGFPVNLPGIKTPAMVRKESEKKQ